MAWVGTFFQILPFVFKIPAFGIYGGLVAIYILHELDMVKINKYFLTRDNYGNTPSYLARVMKYTGKIDRLAFQEQFDVVSGGQQIMWAALSLASAFMFWNPIMWLVDIFVTPGRILSAAFSTVTPSLEMGEPV